MSLLPLPKNSSNGRIDGGRSGAGAAASIDGIIGDSPAMADVYRVTRRVATSNASVLILGETGVGKELIASAIHRLSHRVAGPFVRVNCGALSESLLESELFGHVRGAFTGAVANRTGRFEAAAGGTVFLDEINSTSLILQVKLLRVLQEKEFQRVGDTQTLKSDARIIAASNRDLMREVREDRFREDLYWRLNVVPIEIPPLRKRREDIPSLVKHFLEHFNDVNDRYVVHIGPGTLEALQDYDWPGNVRELQNYIERAVVMAEADELTVDLLPPTVTGDVRIDAAEVDDSYDALVKRVITRGIADASINGDDSGVHGRVVEQIERELIAQILSSVGGVQTKAATRLGINRNTLHKKIKDYGLDG